MPFLWGNNLNSIESLIIVLMSFSDSRWVIISQDNNVPPATSSGTEVGKIKFTDIKNSY